MRKTLTRIVLTLALIGLVIPTAGCKLRRDRSDSSFSDSGFDFAFDFGSFDFVDSVFVDEGSIDEFDDIQYDDSFDAGYDDFSTWNDGWGYDGYGWDNGWKGKKADRK